MTNTQPTALRLADALLAYELSEDYVDATKDAAKELRRLHQVNVELLSALIFMQSTFNPDDLGSKVISTVIAKTQRPIPPN